MTAVPILLGAPGLPGEPELVNALTRPGASVTVVRRCVDAVDLLGAAAGGRARVAVVGPDLPRLARETVARLDAAHLRVVGIAAADDERGCQRLRDLDMPVVTLPLHDMEAALVELARAVEPDTVGSANQPGHDPASSARDAASTATRTATHSPGRLVAVWGPTGAPGRTSVAIGLADELARAGTPSLLVDADTYGGSVATQLGLVEDAAGIVVACRHADGGQLDIASLAATARSVTGALRVVTGVPRAERWAELRPSSLVRLWSACRETPGVTVADVGFALEADEEYLVDTRTPRRNAATLSALVAADLVIAVGAADPVGIERLVSGLAELRRVVGEAPIEVVVTRVRRGPLGRDAERQVREALARHAAVADPVLVPDDREAYDACLREGRTLAEVAPRSTARAPLAALASRVRERITAEA